MGSLSPKPTFIFVPGAWHSPAAFQGIMDILTKQHGYPTLGINLPSVNASPALKTFDEDVVAVRAAISSIVDQPGGGEVILVMHSMGGLPGTEATEGFAVDDRKKEKKEGGVVRLVYISAYAMEEGKSVFEAGADINAITPEALSEKDGYMYVSNAEHLFYNDVDPKIASHWASTLDRQSTGVFTSKTTYAGWKYIPSTYLVCELDNAMPLRYQEMMFATPRVFDVERLQCGHCPFLSHEGFTVGFLRRTAGEMV